MDDMKSPMKALAIALLLESTLTETLENLDATATGEVAHFLFKQRRNEEDFFWDSPSSSQDIETKQQESLSEKAPPQGRH